MILLRKLCQVNRQLLYKKDIRAQLPRTGLPLKWHCVNFLIIFIRNLLYSFTLQTTRSPNRPFIDSYTTNKSFCVNCSNKCGT